MLIYYLLIIVLLNFILSLRFQKNMLAPPVAFNGGFAIACYMATLYYKEWDMQLMQETTFAVIAIGCTLFTVTSIVITKSTTFPSRTIFKEKFEQNFFVYRLINLLVVVAIIQTFVIIVKYRYMSSAFGGYLSFSELLFATRLNSFDEEGVEIYPFWFRNVMQAFTAMSLIWYYLFARYTLSSYKNNKLGLLLIINIILQMGSSLLEGARGGITSSIFLFIVIFTLKYFQYRNRRSLNFKYAVRIVIIAILIGSLLQVSAQLVGRTDKNDDVSSLYYFAYYCGGEIKNLDIDIDDKSYKSENFGDATLNNLYLSVGKYFGTTTKPIKLSYNTWKGLTLGNVKTIFYNMYLDDGFIGVIVFTILMSLISTYVFIKTQKQKKYNQSVFEVAYALIFFSLFMSFFANRFYNEIIAVPFLKELIYWGILSYFINQIITKKCKRL